MGSKSAYTCAIEVWWPLRGEHDFIVSNLEGRENKSDAYSSGHCAAADRIKLLAANWRAGRRAGLMLLETAQQPFETGLD